MSAFQNESTAEQLKDLDKIATADDPVAALEEIQAATERWGADAKVRADALAKLLRAALERARERQWTGPDADRFNKRRAQIRG